MILSEAISKSQTLISINLSSNEIRAEGGQVIIQSLMNNNSIVELNICSVGVEAKKNRLGAEGIKPLRELLNKSLEWAPGILITFIGFRVSKSMHSW